MLTALLVEDSAIIRTLVCSALTRAGFIVDLAGSGLEAVTLLESLEPDVIIIDFQIPGMKGFELVTKMRENPNVGKIPVIVMSANSYIVDPETRERCSGVVVKDADIISNLYKSLAELKLDSRATCDFKTMMLSGPSAVAHQHTSVSQ